MNKYEGMFILNPQLSDEEMDKLIENVQQEIKKNSGEIGEVKRVGRQHMSHKIKKFQEGYYLLIDFKGEGDIIEKTLSKYRINDNILRNLVLKKDKKQ